MDDAVKMTGLLTAVPSSPRDLLDQAKGWGAARAIVIAETEDGQLMWGASFGEAEGLNWLLDLAKTDLAMRCLVPRGQPPGGV